MVIIVAGLAYPIIYNLVMGFFRGGFAGVGARRFGGLYNYIRILRSRDFAEIVRNTCVWTLGITVVIELLSLCVALLLNTNVRGRTGFRVVFLLPFVLPGIVAGLIWRFMLDPQFGALTDALWRLRLTHEYYPWLANRSTALLTVMVVYLWKVSPLPMIMFLASLQTIPVELYEAAHADGAGPWQLLRSITLPMIRGTVVVTTVFMLIMAFNSFDLTYIMTGGGPVRSSEILAMYVYDLAFTSFDYNSASAVATLMFLVSIIFIALYVRRNRRIERDML
jgi:multiple sugar transport system permease protein